MSTVNAVEVIAEALAKHHAVGMGICNCGWSTETKLGHSWREKHEAHQASVIAALPDIAIVEGTSRVEFAVEYEHGLVGLPDSREQADYVVSTVIGARVVQRTVATSDWVMATRAAGGES